MIPVLPTAYPSHPHATAEARKVAQEGLIFLTEVGSGVHGTNLPGTDDRDEMGICVEPPEYVTGLRSFDQFERHTAWDRANGTQERSGAGDLDVTIYGVRKFCRLALDGNPSIIQTLFVPETSIVHTCALAGELLEHAHWFVSLRACDRYLGYLRSQKSGLCGVGRVNRPELIAEHGYDVKFAGHAVRLGVQGLELMRTGRIELPMLPCWQQRIRAIRRGEVPYDEVIALVNHLENQLEESRRRSSWYGVPEEPDRAAVNEWLHRAYCAAWS